MRFWDISTVVKIRYIERAEKRVFGRDGVEKHFDERHAGSGGRATVRDRDSNTTGRPTHASFYIYCIFYELFLDYIFKVGRG